MKYQKRYIDPVIPLLFGFIIIVLVIIAVGAALA